ncbi:enoyl-CoA hydratase/isomerase family protein [Frankia sp. AgB1.9]|uniref:enoyl-CoA hydratase-related protein n=1 Tax=unclassified Frankia TaxID=2632575 RepID=UPI001934070D|nr:MULTISPECIES: enoyl-CoA hydratase-related protein [unclassified Frankia]MBL7487695.1 enoyl-CoA hydratase/isomerase family protein [Frankia sp. AgW1.1]MBL7548062.1 enoyl-CoA hydratase/isomerase family protein [Frankia sp. AgB1.9]MBL7624138.1 enoyl-CoA hydratase/isomerase family protein [Frankia sp. AgB1.8]
MTSENGEAPKPEQPGRPLVATESRDGYAVLTLDDPAHRNALSLELSNALAAAVAAALADGARAIVLTACPPVFSSGGNLDDLITPKAPLREVYAGMLAVAGAPVPTIAAVDGPAIGAGVNLPLACDIVLASPRAAFDPRFLDVGIHPGGGHLWRLAHRVGPQGAAALVLCGDRLTGAEAAATGLAWRCVPSDELLARACALAARAAGRPAELVARTKETLRASLAVTSAQAAVELELEAQEWSVGRPGFADHVRALRDQLRAAREAKAARG